MEDKIKEIMEAKTKEEAKKVYDELSDFFFGVAF